MPFQGANSTRLDGIVLRKAAKAQRSFAKCVSSFAPLRLCVICAIEGSGEEEECPFGYEGHKEEESEEEGEGVEFAGYEGVYLSQITYEEVHEGSHEDEEDVDEHPPTDLHSELESDHHVD